jgi:hypothetical protein
MIGDGYVQDYRGRQTLYTRAGHEVPPGTVDDRLTFMYRLINDRLYSLLWQAYSGGIVCLIPVPHTDKPPAAWHTDLAAHVTAMTPCPRHQTSFSERLNAECEQRGLATACTADTDTPVREYQFPSCLKCGTPMPLFCPACDADGEERLP